MGMLHVYTPAAYGRMRRVGGGDTCCFSPEKLSEADRCSKWSCSGMHAVRSRELRG